MVQHEKTTTKLVCGFICDDDLNRLNKRCHAVGGLCSKSGKPHFHLTATGPGGICWTRIAQPYPHGLARALSHCLLSDARQKFMKRNSDHSCVFGCYIGLPYSHSISCMPEDAADSSMVASQNSFLMWPQARTSLRARNT